MNVGFMERLPRNRVFVWNIFNRVTRSKTLTSSAITARYVTTGLATPSLHLIDSPRFGASDAPTVYETRGDSKL